jgi:methylmalonyl-CoA epimerase
VRRRNGAPVSDHLRIVPDHVAVAVPDLEAASRRWRDELGGGLVNEWEYGDFAGRQYRYPNGTKLELISPSPGTEGTEGFVARYLERFGAGIHHVTLLVDDIRATLATARDAGLDVVDERLEHEAWKEGFLRPSQVGGLVIQIAQATHTAEQWAELRGVTPVAPAEGAAHLLGPTLRHPDLDAAARLWKLLGGELDTTPDGLLVAWHGVPLTVRIVPGEPAGPVALRCTGTPDLPADGVAGPAVVGDR